MSFSEIKKSINSDLSVPLNKLMDYGGTLLDRFDIVKLDTSSKILLNIQGSGRVYFLALKNVSRNNDSGDFTLEIDGKVIARSQMQMRKGDASNPLIPLIDSITPISKSSYIEMMFRNQQYYVLPSHSNTVYSATWNKSSAGGYFYRPINFNKSLKLTAKLNSDSAEAYLLALYSLYD